MRSKIRNLIDNSNSILLLTHQNPDGDAIGSVLGMYHYLLSINKSVDMVILDIPKVFNFLPSIDRIVDTTDKEYDLGIVVDCANRERISQKEDLLSRCKNTICIDHHISNTKYCDVNYIEGSISSCSQVIYYLLKDFGVSFNKEMGESLISGVLTDTNGFAINTVDSQTFNMAAEINDLGIDIHALYDKLLCKKTMSQYKLMQIGMDRLEFLCDGKIAFTYILKEDFDKVCAVLGEHEGIVDISRNIEGVEVSIFIREDDGWTVSLRSTGVVDVSKVANAIGGGGHVMAAGGKLSGTLEETKERIINETKKVMLLK
ncbi:MAG: bifunctional oligoribonuclease/PAP phosphatase NrnA [Bacilli bacterium]|nr:bifunctional oligoribonuclease/PAP phosphatase NrnA [Bacilli bacterium]